MISVVHNVVVKAIHTLLLQDALGLAKAYFSAPRFRKTFEKERGKMESYAYFTVNRFIVNLLSAYTYTTASRSYRRIILGLVMSVMRGKKHYHQPWLCKLFGVSSKQDTAELQHANVCGVVQQALQLEKMSQVRQTG